MGEKCSKPAPTKNGETKLHHNCEERYKAHSHRAELESHLLASIALQCLKFSVAAGRSRWTSEFPDFIMGISQSTVSPTCTTLTAEPVSGIGVSHGDGGHGPT